MLRRVIVTMTLLSCSLLLSRIVPSYRVSCHRLSAYTRLTGALHESLTGKHEYMLTGGTNGHLFIQNV